MELKHLESSMNISLHGSFITRPRFYDDCWKDSFFIHSNQQFDVLLAPICSCEHTSGSAANAGLMGSSPLSKANSKATAAANLIVYEMSKVSNRAHSQLSRDVNPSLQPDQHHRAST